MSPTLLRLRSSLLSRFVEADAEWRFAHANPRTVALEECERLYAEMLCAEDQLCACEDELEGLARAWAGAGEGWRRRQETQGEAVRP